MKIKLFALSAFFLFSPVAFANPSLTVVPTTINYEELETTLISITSQGNPWSDLNVAIYPNDLTNNDGKSCSFIQSNQNDTFKNLITPNCIAKEGIYHIVGYSRSGGAPSTQCQTGVYTDCIGNQAYNDVGQHDIIFTVGNPPTPDTLGIMLTAASAGMEKTTGFNVASTVAWTGDNLIKLFIGSVLAVLLSLRGWLVALVIIGSIVYFAYRAFRFFRH